MGFVQVENPKTVVRRVSQGGEAQEIDPSGQMYIINFCSQNCGEGIIGKLAVPREVSSFPFIQEKGNSTLNFCSIRKSL